MTQQELMKSLYDGICENMGKAGYTIVPAQNEEGRKTVCYDRGPSTVIDFDGTKNKARFVYNDDRIHFLFASPDVDGSDDSGYTIDTTYLFVLSEYDEKDLKSLVNEINDYLIESFIEKHKDVKIQTPKTVSRTAAKSGALAYDSFTLATKIGAAYAPLKPEIENNIAKYGEFLAEDFFVNHANNYIVETIRKNDTQKMKKLFNILSDVYEDGTNEVQSMIAVTIIGTIAEEPELHARIIPYLSDTMLEPVTAVLERLGKSKSSRMRLENPPKYKPPRKKKSEGLMSKLLQQQQ